MYRSHTHTDSALIQYTTYAGRSCLRLRVTPEQESRALSPWRKQTMIYCGEHTIATDSNPILRFSICVPATWRFEDGFGEPDYAVKILTLHGTGERGEVGLYINRDQFEFSLHSDPGEVVPNRTMSITPDRWYDFEVRAILGRSDTAFIDVTVGGLRWFKFRHPNVPEGEDVQWLVIGMDTRGASLGKPNFPEGCFARDLYFQFHELRWGR